MDSLISSEVGKTVVQGAWNSDASNARLAARRPWTVMGPMALEIDVGAVRRVRKAVVGIIRSVSPVWFGIRDGRAACNIGESHWALKERGKPEY